MTKIIFDTNAVLTRKILVTKGENVSSGVAIL